MFVATNQPNRGVCRCHLKATNDLVRDMVMGQLVERSLLTPEIRCLNPDFGKKIIAQFYNRKDENKEKESGNGPSFLKTMA